MFQGLTVRVVQMSFNFLNESSKNVYCRAFELRGLGLEIYEKKCRDHLRARSLHHHCPLQLANSKPGQPQQHNIEAVTSMSSLCSTSD